MMDKIWWRGIMHSHGGPWERGNMMETGEGRGPPRPRTRGSASLPSERGEAHRRYTRHINFREGWRGYLWQGRFASFVMDEDHFLAALRYVELNPLRAGLVGKPGDWPWSSAHAHLSGEADPLLSDMADMIDYIGDWEAYLALDIAEEQLRVLRQHGRTGRPLGSAPFILQLEQTLGRFLRKRKPGPKGPRKPNN